MATFDSDYKKLNPQQREAVDTIEGPVMVIAGPGTGKTQVLTLRIANILKRTDIPPEAILALTFTESGAASMRSRLTEIMGSDGYRVKITTFHGFCNDIIGTYPEEFPNVVGSRHINALDQVHIMERAIAEAEVKQLRPFGNPSYYLRPALSAINELKREGISPQDFKDALVQEKKRLAGLRQTIGKNQGITKGAYIELEKRLSKNEELLLLYTTYQKLLASERLYDYTDMIMEVLEALKNNKGLLLMIQEKHQYVLVDEHQDTNNAQNKILELLINFHDNPNVFLVGDEKQAIFRFQGASIENFLYLKKLYPKAKIIYLEQNYRSTQNILDAAQSLMPHGKQLKAQDQKKQKKINLYSFATSAEESYFLAEHIKNRIKAGVLAEEIAILYREHRDGLPIAVALQALGVPHVIESDRDVLRDLEIRKILLICQAAQKYGDAETLLEMLHVDFLQIDPLDVYKLSSFAYRKRVNPYDVIRSRTLMDEAGIKSRNILEDAVKNLSFWHETFYNQPAMEAFETIMRGSGFLKHIISLDQSEDKINAIRILFDHLKDQTLTHRDYRLGDFLKYLDVLEEHEILVKPISPVNPVGLVRLMTVHRAKGMEFEYTYIVNCTDNRWGTRRHREHFHLPHSLFTLKPNQNLEVEHDVVNDERNIFYVALTRAKKEVTITYALRDEQGKERLVSSFIEELKADLLNRVEGQVITSKQWLSKIDSVSTTPLPSRLSDKKYLNQLFEEQGLSVTALNNYLECPWKYFYVNLIRLPEALNKHLMYGSAIHVALCDFFQAWTKGDHKTQAFLQKQFEHHLEKQPLADVDFNETLKNGKIALAGYYKTYHAVWPDKMYNELKITTNDFDPSIRLNGTIDRIDMLDERGRVAVIDYKTGKPKTRGFIQGTTADSNGNYKRQLVFYKLLLQFHDKGKYRTEKGIIDFVEPETNGKYRREEFDIEMREVEDLKKTIHQAAKEIRNLVFWNKICDEKDCRYCDLRKVMTTV